MKLFHRIWTGIVGAVAGIAVAALVQVIGMMTGLLSIDALAPMGLVSASAGFVLGAVIGPRRVSPVKDAK
jgi:hypothetical protein